MDKGIEQAFPNGQQAYSTPGVITGWHKEKALPYSFCEHSSHRKQSKSKTYNKTTEPKAGLTSENQCYQY